MKILMLASENAALPNAKVGGIGDVLREMPTALASLGHEVDVVLPAYHHLASVPGMQPVAKLPVEFADNKDEVELLRLSEMRTPHPKLRLWVLASPHYAVGPPGSIYHHDPDGSPFATDASLFAHFCKAAVETLRAGHFTPHPDAIHLHDWHTTLAALLLRHDDRYKRFARIRIVYTIHNLALQGVRPLRDHPSSLAAWFPKLDYPLDKIRDPRSTDCINLARVGIRLADRVHTVSPTYAGEVTRPSDSTRGFFGGEGLEDDLKQAQQQEKLFGIINGCEYPGPPAATPHQLTHLFRACETTLRKWIAPERHLPTVHYTAQRRLEKLFDRHDDPFLLTSVGRVTIQKIALLRYPHGQQLALDSILDLLGNDGILIAIGSGDPTLEDFLASTSVRHDNFIYLRGYDEEVPKLLYQLGDLFLMPSSFEPCGISQMLAMRDGQPCLVHGVGGLKDTVEDGKTGFIFEGKDPAAQSQAMITTLERALRLRKEKPLQWATIRENARRARFKWSDSAQAYVRDLYDKLGR